MKQSKNGTVTLLFFHLPKNYYVCQMIAVKKRHSLLRFAWFTLKSWLWFLFVKIHFFVWTVYRNLLLALLCLLTEYCIFTKVICGCVFGKIHFFEWTVYHPLLLTLPTCELSIEFSVIKVLNLRLRFTFAWLILERSTFSKRISVKTLGKLLT